MHAPKAIRSENKLPKVAAVVAETAKQWELKVRSIWDALL
jgi:hypothetical protein